MILSDNKIPMRWWSYTRNFGDLLGPWLVQKMTGKEIVWVPKHKPHYLTVGSILGHVSPASIVWGTGSFGNEHGKNVELGDRYLAVRGPLTRARLEMFKQSCPRIYGDPALLVPDYYPRKSEPTEELGVVLRWSERKRKRAFDIEGVRLIDLETDDIEGTLDSILACKRIVSTSLHGLILADAYGIPNAWLIAETGYGKEHKFWDYLLSVRKERNPHDFDITASTITLEELIGDLNFDDRDIQIDLELLRQSNPFWNTSESVWNAEQEAFAGSESLIEKGKVDTVSTRPRYEM